MIDSLKLGETLSIVDSPTSFMQNQIQCYEGHEAASHLTFVLHIMCKGGGRNSKVGARWPFTKCDHFRMHHAATAIHMDRHRVHKIEFITYLLYLRKFT